MSVVVTRATDTQNSPYSNHKRRDGLLAT